MARYIVCSKCQQLGGTLRKVDDHYQHDRCPAPLPKVQRIAVPRSNLVLPTVEDVELRRMLRSKRA